MADWRNLVSYTETSTKQRIVARSEIRRIENRFDKLAAEMRLGHAIEKAARAVYDAAEEVQGADGYTAFQIPADEFHDLQEVLLPEPHTLPRINDDYTESRINAAEIRQYPERIERLRSELCGLCEHYEDESYDALNGERELTEHEQGYHRGQKTTAKRIRRVMSDLFVDEANSVSDNQERSDG